MPSRFDAAIALDIPIEMVKRHGIPMQLTQEELDELHTNPPAWLAQSRANRTGKKAVWVTLECAVCGFSETVRPKKWWPDFTLMFCHTHDEAALPAPVGAATVRRFTYGVGTRFNGAVDSAE